VAGFRGGEVRSIASPFKNRHMDARADGRDFAGPVDEGAEVCAGESGGAGEFDRGEERGFSHTDTGAFGVEALFGFDNVGTSLEKFRWEAGRDFGSRDVRVARG